MDILQRMKLRLRDVPDLDDDELNDIIETAKNAILSRRFPYGDWPTKAVPVVDEEGNQVYDEDDNPVMTEETYVEPRYQDLQFRIAMDIFNKKGAEGEMSHSANGISRTYNGAWVSEQLLQEIVPYCGVIK